MEFVNEILPSPWEMQCKLNSIGYDMEYLDTLQNSTIERLYKEVIELEIEKLHKFNPTKEQVEEFTNKAYDALKKLGLDK